MLKGLSPEDLSCLAPGGVQWVCFCSPDFGTCVEFFHALFKSRTEICGQVSVKSFPGDEERESNLLFMGIHTLRLCAIVSLSLAPA